MRSCRTYRNTVTWIPHIPEKKKIRHSGKVFQNIKKKEVVKKLTKTTQRIYDFIGSF